MKRTPTHCACRKEQKGYTLGSSLPLIGGVLIALLPKCPFCILAYSSAISLCGGSQFHHPAWSSWISIVFACITLALVLYNYKGRRTLFAALLVSLGAALIIWAELKTGKLAMYNSGAILLLLGVWVNGSLAYFIRKIRDLLGKTEVKEISRSF